MKEIDFKKICDNLIDAIYVTDAEGNTIYVNDAYLKLGNLRREELMGMNVFNPDQTKQVYTGGVLPDVLKSGRR